MSEFALRLLRWHQQHGRHDLPWQASRAPYPVWLSEIMLQQTQVATVIPYYHRFLNRFPTLESLAKADPTEVMTLWSGLGYYARARNLHRCARKVWFELGGEFPREPSLLADLPGIGRSTANAIATFCFGARVPILDGNVKRVFARLFGIAGFPGSTETERQLWRIAEDQLPQSNLPDYIQAQMDFGATHCTRVRPRCTDCPMQGICAAERAGMVAELPTPRPKRKLPHRQVTLLILNHSGRILLEQRPASGIWGGLLSLPELPEGADPHQFAGSRLGSHASTFLELPEVTHSFTHFRLGIKPLFANVKPTVQIQEPGKDWVAIGSLDTLPLPAPIRLLLQKLSQSTSLCAPGNV